MPIPQFFKRKRVSPLKLVAIFKLGAARFSLDDAGELFQTILNSPEYDQDVFCQVRKIMDEHGPQFTMRGGPVGGVPAGDATFISVRDYKTGSQMVLPADSDFGTPNGKELMFGIIKRSFEIPPGRIELVSTKVKGEPYFICIVIDD